MVRILVISSIRHDVRFIPFYRRYENRAIAEAQANPDRAQEELTQKRTTKAIREPSPGLISQLAAHNVHYTGKAASYAGDRNWSFQVNDPDRSARSFGVLSRNYRVPVSRNRLRPHSLPPENTPNSQFDFFGSRSESHARRYAPCCS
jgi:hypothetical protein